MDLLRKSPHLMFVHADVIVLLSQQIVLQFVLSIHLSQATVLLERKDLRFRRMHLPVKKCHLTSTSSHLLRKDRQHIPLNEYHLLRKRVSLASLHKWSNVYPVFSVLIRKRSEERRV